jgi:hypothetical protein
VKRKTDRRIRDQQRYRAIQGANHRAERVVLVAELLLGRLRAVVADVPDLVRQRELLRAEQRERQ